MGMLKKASPLCVAEGATGGGLITAVTVDKKMDFGARLPVQQHKLLKPL